MLPHRNNFLMTSGLKLCSRSALLLPCSSGKADATWQWRTLWALLCPLHWAVFGARKTRGCLRVQVTSVAFHTRYSPRYLLPGTYIHLVVFFWKVSGQEMLERIVWQLPDNDRRIQMHFPPPPCWSLAVDSVDGVCCSVDPHFRSKLCPEKRVRTESPALDDQRSFTLKAERKDKAFFIAKLFSHWYSFYRGIHHRPETFFYLVCKCRFPSIKNTWDKVISCLRRNEIC